MRSIKGLQEYIGTFGATVVVVTGFISGNTGVLVTCVLFVCGALLYVMLSKKEPMVLGNVVGGAAQVKTFRYARSQRYAAGTVIILLMAGAVLYLAWQVPGCLKKEHPMLYVTSFEDQNNAFQKNLVSNLDALIGHNATPELAMGHEAIAYKNPVEVGEITQHFCEFSGLVVYGNASFSEGPQYLNCYITVVNMLDSVYAVDGNLMTIQFSFPETLEISFHDRASCVAHFVLSFFETSKGDHQKAIAHLTACRGDQQLDTGYLEYGFVRDFIIINLALLGDSKWESLYLGLNPEQRATFNLRFDVNCVFKKLNKPIQRDTVKKYEPIKEESIGVVKPIPKSNEEIHTPVNTAKNEEKPSYDRIVHLFNRSRGIFCDNTSGQLFASDEPGTAKGSFTIEYQGGNMNFIRQLDRLTRTPIDSIFWCNDPIFGKRDIYFYKPSYRSDRLGRKTSNDAPCWHIFAPCTQKLITPLKEAFSLEKAFRTMLEKSDKLPRRIHPDKIGYEIHV